ncbi:MAG: hypothetical protein A3J28_05380 [Acidobacteria bacterium RIFCSPLOWO2_12_FULL_60_22]|nr:MAG: hypothetical protein A3J28_05380 [Acidobacteria bacterium RIFCSPLOWO2_12_FULL_60_22]
MARKRKKRERQERSAGEADLSTASSRESEEWIGSLPEAESPTPVHLRSNEKEFRMMEEMPERKEEGRRWEGAPERNPSPPRGLLARLSRWLQGPEQPSAAPPEIPQPPPTPNGAPELWPPIEAAAPKPPPAEASDIEPMPTPIEEVEEPSPKPVAHSPASNVDHVLAILTLERVLPELDAVRRELDEVKETAALRTRQLEAERDQSQAEANAARAEKSEIETRAGMLRKAVDTFERQLQEAKETAEERIRQLVTERDQSLAQAERSRADQHDTHLRIRQLEAQFDINQASHTAQEWSALELRVGTLQEELDASQRRFREEGEAAEARLRLLETEREKLAAQLASQEQEVLTLRERMETALAEARKPEAQPAELAADTGTPRAEPSPPQEGAPTAAVLDAAQLADFYQQSMSILTVILASVELLAMNPRLEPSLRETAQEIRAQGKRLVDLIRSYTLPPKSEKAE